MNEQQQIDKLTQELAKARHNMNTCEHVFHTPKHDPETISVGYGCVQDGSGSDPHWSYAGYRDEKKDRWSRECKKCGLIEYTYELEPVIERYIPKFK